MRAMTMARMGKRGGVLLTLAPVALLCAFWGRSVSAQTQPPLPTALDRTAWFGCDSMTVNGNTKVYGVPAVNGAQGFGGHVASNGNILVNGTNTIAGNATPGPGMAVTVNGNQNQVQGSKTPATSTLPCEEVSVSSWATWASANNNNASIPSTYFSTSTRNFTLNGNKTCTLAAGTYYLNNVMCNGNCKLIAGGPVIVVATGTLTINGNCEVNKDGNPGNLFFLVTTSAAVTLNGGAKMDLKVYAPLAAINLNGTVTGCGNLWGKTFTGNGNVTWNRLKDSTAPSLSITSPANGSTVAQPQPSIAITYSDGTGGSGLNLQSLLVKLDGMAITNGLTVTATGATGTAPSVLTDGSHTLTASISDYDGNTASGQSDFTVQSAADHDPPVITVTGIEENGLYSAPVTPSITVTDPNLDASSVVIILDGLTYVSGTTVSAEGTHTLHAAASDTFGNHAEKDVHFTLAFDHQGPAITITGVTDGSWYNLNVSVQVSVTDTNLDPASVQITLNGQAYVSGTPVTADGYYTLYVTASDTSGNASQAAVSFAIDKTAPQISVTSPADNATVSASPVTLTGYVMDASPDALTVNGQAVGSPGQSSFSTPVALVEGANTIALAATDRAGNTGGLTWHVTLKTSAPTVSIASPIEGLVTRSSSASVTGTASSDAVSVTVNGKVGSLSGGSFTVASVPLAEGANTLTATVRDTAGNAGTASVHVTKDSQAPAIAVSTPANNSHTGEGSVTVSGTIGDASPVTATLNGSPLSLSGNAFSTSATLVPGTNLLTLRATDAPGNTAERTITVVQDTGSFTVTRINPANGGSGVSSTSSIEVTFNRSVKASTVTASSFTVTSGQAVAGALVAQDNTVTFLPASAYPASTQVQVALSAGVTDLSGTALAPFTSTFTTLGEAQAGLTLTLDGVSSLVNHSPVTVTGKTGAGASVSITGGASPVTATADAQGAFSADLSLTPDSQNLFTAQASLGGQQSPAVPFSILHDGQKPYVVAFTPGTDLLVDFNEAVAESSVTAQSVSLTVSGQGAACTSVLELSGTRLRITPSTAIGSNPAVLAVTTGVTDLAGNPLREAFTKAFNGGTSGDAFLVGEAYDDASGLPLPGVSVALTGNTGASTSTGAMGAWALSVPSGEVTVHLMASGYSDAYRTASVPSGEIQAALDARLRPLSTQAQILGAAGGTATFAGGQVTLTAQSGAFIQDATLTVTTLSGQSLPFPLPPGFSPWAAFRVDASAAPSQPLTLSVARAFLPAQAPSGSIPAAVFDAEGIQWMGTTPANNDGSNVALAIWRTGVSAPQVIVFLRPDESPSSPPAVQDGHALQGVSATALDSATATLTADPASIPPDGKATATVAITPSSAAPSSLPFAVTFTESLDVREGSTTVTKHFSPYTADLTAYQDPSAPSTLKVSFPVSPFPGIDVLTLLTGRIDLSVGPYWEGNLGGGIVGPSGGSVDGSGGTHVTIPAGATSSPLPVRVFPVASSSLLAAIPQGFAYAGGIELSLGGGTLSSPATLSLDASALAVSITTGDTVLLVKAATEGGVATYLLVDVAVLSSDKLATLSGAGYPSALSGLPWTTVKEEGRYVFLKATSPIAFATGRVTDGSAPLSNALAGILPTQQAAGGSSSGSSSQSLKSRVAGLAKDGKAPKAAESLVELTGINFVTGADGRYLVAATLGNRQVKAVHLLTADEGTASVALSTANQPVTQDVAIAAAPLTVTSTYPASGAQNVPTGAEITVTFSKLLDPASVTADHFQVSGGQTLLSGQLRIITGGTTLAFTPGATLPGGASVSITVTGVADRLGRALASPYTFSFTTLLLNPPHLDPGKIEARLPNAQGQICVAGGPGAVEGQATVYIVNATHYAYGTVTGTAGNDGSFSLCIQGELGDRIELHVPASDGTERLYAFDQLVSDDHQTVGLGPSGGTFTSKNADGTPIATISVPPGAFSGPATISLKPGDAGQAPAVPDSFAAGAPVQVTLSASANKEIALVLPAPSSWDLSDPAKQYWLVKSATWGPSNTVSPMLATTMRATACAGGAGQCLASNCPPYPGLVESGLYQPYQAPGDWGFFTGTYASAEQWGSAVASCAGSPFVYLMDAVLGTTWFLPVPPSPPSGGYTITVSDSSTGEVLTTVTRTDPPNPGTPTDIGIVSNVPTWPYPMDASPFKAFAFQLKTVSLASSDPMVSMQLAFGTSPVLTITAGPGTAAPGTDQTPATVTIGDGNETIETPVLSDGSFTATLTSLSSNNTVTVTYPAASGSSATATATIPAPPITDKLSLSLQNGHLTLQAATGFGDAGDSLFLYNAMVSAGSMPLRETALGASGVLSLDLTGGAALSSGDVLFYTLEKKDVDASSSIGITFDSALSGTPDAPLSETNPVPQGPAVTLVDLADTSHVVPISVTLTNGRLLSVRPDSGLKAGAEYVLRLWSLASQAGNAYPQGTPVKARFKVYGGGDVGTTPYAEVYDMARRGAILYMAVGDQGFDIVDASDPTSPATAVNGPVQTMESMRGVAIAENVPVPEGGQTNGRTLMALVGGGGNGQQGEIRLYYADFPEDTADQSVPQTAAIGMHISGAKLCDATGSGSTGGWPNVVKTVGTTAFVSTVGIGMQQVDLAAVAQQNTNAVRYQVGNYWTGPEPRPNGMKDISMGIQGLNVLPPASQGQNPYVVAAVKNWAMAAWQVSGSAPVEAGYALFPACLHPDGAMRVQVYPDYQFTHVKPDGTQEPRTLNLVLLAGGAAGLLVYSAQPSGTQANLTLINRIPLADSCYDVAVDTRRHTAYLANYTAGVAIVDLSDPLYESGDFASFPDCAAWSQKYGTTEYGLLDRNSDQKDDRIQGYLAIASGSRATIVVDSETGLVYTGEQGGAASGLHVKGAHQPRVEFLLDDPANPGQYKIPGYLSAYDGDKPRLGLWLPGGAGTSISGATLQLYDRNGIEETPSLDANNNPVASTVYRTVNLIRQSAKRTESKYNFYIQDPNQPVTLGMVYDPANPDPTLMVSKQSGSLKGTATTTAWHDGTANWGRSVSVEKEVSRPWIELAYNRPSPESAGILIRKEETSQPDEVAYLDPRNFTFFLVGRERDFGVKVHLKYKPVATAIRLRLEPADAGQLYNGSTAVAYLDFPLTSPLPADGNLNFCGKMKGLKDTIANFAFDLMYNGSVLKSLDRTAILVSTVDLFIDSNNDGEITPEDQPYAAREPGKLIYLNQDDDNQNDQEDSDDNGHSSGQQFAADDDDLQPFILDFGAQLKDGQLSLQAIEGQEFIRIWSSKRKLEGSEISLKGGAVSWTLPSNTVLRLGYLEGKKTGPVVLELRYSRNGEVVCSRKVKAGIIGLSYEVAKLTGDAKDIPDTAFGFDHWIDDLSESHTFPKPTSSANPPQKYDWVSVANGDCTTEIKAKIEPVNYSNWVYFITTHDVTSDTKDEGTASVSPAQAEPNSGLQQITIKGLGDNVTPEYPTVLARLGSANGAKANRLRIGVYRKIVREGHYWTIEDPRATQKPAALSAAVVQQDINQIIKQGVAEISPLLDKTPGTTEPIEYMQSGPFTFGTLHIYDGQNAGGPASKKIADAIIAYYRNQNVVQPKIILVHVTDVVKHGLYGLQTTPGAAFGYQAVSWVFISDFTTGRQRLLGHEILHTLGLTKETQNSITTYRGDLGPQGKNKRNVMYYLEGEDGRFLGNFLVQPVETGTGTTPNGALPIRQWDEMKRFP